MRQVVVSDLGGRLRRLAGRERPSFADSDRPDERGFKNGLVFAASAADDAEHLALVDSAEGRGRHVALALTWAADRLEASGLDERDVRSLRGWAAQALEP